MRMLAFFFFWLIFFYNGLFLRVCVTQITIDVKDKHPPVAGTHPPSEPRLDGTSASVKYT